MATIPTWQQIRFDQPDVSSYTRTAGDLFNKAITGARAGIEARRNMLTDENTRQIMADIQNIGTLDQYNAEQANLAAKLAGYGSLVDFEKANAALQGRDEAIFSATKQADERADYTRQRGLDATRIANKPLVANLQGKLAEAARTGDQNLYDQTVNEYAAIRGSLLPETASTLDTAISNAQSGIRAESQYQLGLANTASANNLASVDAYLSGPDTNLGNLDQRIELVKTTEEYKNLNPTDKRTIDTRMAGLSRKLQEDVSATQEYNTSQKAKATEEYFNQNYAQGYTNTIGAIDLAKDRETLGDRFDAATWNRLAKQSNDLLAQTSKTVAEEQSKTANLARDIFKDTDYFGSNAIDQANEAIRTARSDLDLNNLDLTGKQKEEFIRVMLQSSVSASGFLGTGALDDFDQTKFNKVLEDTIAKLKSEKADSNAVLANLRKIALENKAKKQNISSSDANGA